MFPHGSVQSESHREELHESQNTDGLKNRHSCLHLKLHPHSTAGIGLFWKLDFREMMLIFGLMLLLLQTAACQEFNCRFNQKDPCYAALGHKLNLKMVDAGQLNLKILKRIYNNTDDPVCRVKKDKIKQNECDLFNKGTEVTVINGTLIINRVIRADSGNYTLGLEDSEGKETSADLQVIVEALIGSVNVSISCSSNGMKSVSCSSDGDQLVYSWTLNGKSLMNGNTTIELNETDGNIICSVKNHVSHRQKSISVQPCPGSTTAAVTSSLTSTLTSSTQTSDHGTSFSPTGTNQTPTLTLKIPEAFPLSKLIQMSLIALGCISLILILLFITACHFYKRKQLQSTPAPAGDTELVYAQISHDKHKKSEKNKSESLPSADVEYAAVRPQTKRKEKKEEEVQYGEVTFTPKSSNALQEPKEECVYSQVQRR